MCIGWLLDYRIPSIRVFMQLCYIWNRKDTQFINFYLLSFAGTFEALKTQTLFDGCFIRQRCTVGAATNQVRSSSGRHLMVETRTEATFQYRAILEGMPCTQITAEKRNINQSKFIYFFKTILLSFLLNIIAILVIIKILLLLILQKQFVFSLFWLYFGCDEEK